MILPLLRRFPAKILNILNGEEGKKFRKKSLTLIFLFVFINVVAILVNAKIKQTKDIFNHIINYFGGLEISPVALQAGNTS